MKYKKITTVKEAKKVYHELGKIKQRLIIIALKSSTKRVKQSAVKTAVRAESLRQKIKEQWALF